MEERGELLEDRRIRDVGDGVMCAGVGSCGLAVCFGEMDSENCVIGGFVPWLDRGFVVYLERVLNCDKAKTEWNQ